MKTVARSNIGFAEPWFEHGLHSGNGIEDGRICERNLECAIAACGYTSNGARREAKLGTKKRNEIVYDEGVPANRPARFFHVVIEPSARSGDPHRQDNAGSPPFIKERLQIE
jgi:hypothetical protein